MVTFADLRQADLQPLQTAGQTWRDHAAAVRDLAERMNTDVAGALLASGWGGDIAETAVARSEQIEERFEIRAHVAELVASVYDSAYERLWRLRWRLISAVDSAGSLGMTVREDGTVEPPPAQPWEHNLDGGAWLAERAQRARELTEQITGIVAEADAIDRQTAEALASLSPDDTLGLSGWQELGWDAQGLASDYGLSYRDIPDQDDPAANAAWWASLSEAEQAMYLAAYPRLIGGLDGLPVAVRDQANQLALQYALSSPTLNPRSRERAQDLLDRLEESEYGPPEQRLHLIGYDLAGDGRAIISVGNPDTADHTAVWVPGVNSTIDNIGGDLTRVRDLQREADRLTRGVSGDVATVMWLGYDAPGADLSAIRGAHAEAGAPLLDSFLDGLRVSHTGGPDRLTVIGHSYGSTVVGEAASAGDGLAVDDIIVAGSPGMRVDGVADLQIDPRHVWAGAAEGDDVTGWMSHFAHGPEPHKEGFGANRFEVDTTGHSDYWKRGSESLDNQAAIVVGRYELVDLEHGERPR